MARSEATATEPCGPTWNEPRNARACTRLNSLRIRERRSLSCGVVGGEKFMNEERPCTLSSRCVFGDFGGGVGGRASEYGLVDRPRAYAELIKENCSDVKESASTSEESVCEWTGSAASTRSARRDEVRNGNPRMSNPPWLESSKSNLGRSAREGGRGAFLSSARPLPFRLGRTERCLTSTKKRSAAPLLDDEYAEDDAPLVLIALDGVEMFVFSECCEGRLNLEGVAETMITPSCTCERDDCESLLSSALLLPPSRPPTLVTTVTLDVVRFCGRSWI